MFYSILFYSKENIGYNSETVKDKELTPVVFHKPLKGKVWNPAGTQQCAQS